MPRRGLTLVELLVAVAVLAVAVGLGLAAVQKVRASSARAHCGNNLRQIALALHAYDEHTAALPPAGGARRVQMTTGRYRPISGSLHYFLLPFVEQEPLQRAIADVTPEAVRCYCAEHEALRRGSAVADGGFAGDVAGLDMYPRHATPKVFVCPADPSTVGGVGRTPFGDRIGVTQYAAAAPALGNHRYDGGKVTLARGFPDGVSQCVVLAERYGRCGGLPRSPNWLADDPLPTSPVFGYRRAGQWLDPTAEVIRPPQVTPTVDDCRPDATQSPHPGAILAGFADGSARPLGPGLSVDTWAALVRPADGAIPTE